MGLAALAAIQNKLTPCQVAQDGSVEVATANPAQIINLGKLVLRLYKRLQTGGKAIYQFVFYRAGKAVTIETRRPLRNASQAQAVEAVADAVKGKSALVSARFFFKSVIHQPKLYYSDNVNLVGLNNAIKGRAFRLPLKLLDTFNARFERTLYTKGLRPLTAREVKMTALQLRGQGCFPAELAVDCAGCTARESHEMADPVLRQLDFGAPLVKEFWNQGRT